MPEFFVALYEALSAIVEHGLSEADVTFEETDGDKTTSLTITLRRDVTAAADCE